eukprot:11216651-Lingulodinium_polyedra.AAC.1
MTGLGTHCPDTRTHSSGWPPPDAEICGWAPRRVARRRRAKRPGGPAPRCKGLGGALETGMRAP